MAFNDLPPELLLDIADYLSDTDITFLRLVCRGFMQRLPPHPYARPRNPPPILARTWAFVRFDERAAVAIDFRRRFLHEADDLFGHIPGHRDFCALCFKLTRDEDFFWPDDALIDGKYAVCKVCTGKLVDGLYRSRWAPAIPPRGEKNHCGLCGYHQDFLDIVPGAVAGQGGRRGLVCAKCLLQALERVLTIGRFVSFGPYHKRFMCGNCTSYFACYGAGLHRWHGGDGRVLCGPCHSGICRDPGCQGWPAGYVRDHWSHFY